MREIGHGRIVGPEMRRPGDAVGVTMPHRGPSSLDRKNVCVRPRLGFGYKELAQNLNMPGIARVLHRLAYRRSRHRQRLG